MEPLSQLLKHVLIHIHTHQIDVVSYNVMQSLILEMFPLNLKVWK